MNLAMFIGLTATLGMGVAFGLTGGGGSILTIPILVYLFKIPALEATAYSLAIVGFTALWGAIDAHRRGELDLKCALKFGLAGVCGVWLSRRVLLPKLPDTINLFSASFTRDSFLLVCFAIIMLLAAFSMMLSATQTVSFEATRAPMKRPRLGLFLGGFAIGVLSGFLGAGGGFLIVPALVHFANLGIKEAIGSSLFVISLQCLLGILGDTAALANFDLKLLFTIVALAMIGMSFGGKLRKLIPTSQLKLGFGLFVLLMGTFIFYQEFQKGLR